MTKMTSTIAFMLLVCQTRASLPSKHKQTVSIYIGLLHRSSSSSVNRINLLMSFDNYIVGGGIKLGLSQIKQLVVFQQGNLNRKNIMRNSAINCYRVTCFDIKFIRYNH